MQNNIKVSVIIISKDDTRQENVDWLVRDMSSQKINAEVEICKVLGISPAGRARNVGAEKARGDYLVFVDDDVRITQEEALAGLIQPLLDEENIAATFSSLLIPKDSSAFQRQYAQEIPRSQIPVVEKQIDAGAFSTHFCAIRKVAFIKIGMFNENLKRGEDPEISHRLKMAGFRLVLVPKVLCYHPVPKNLAELTNIHFRNGMSVAFADMHYPKLNIDVNPKGIIYPTKMQTKSYRLIRFISGILTSFFSAKLLLMLSKISYLLGYFYAFLAE